jgi:hypothetical protein
LWSDVVEAEVLQKIDQWIKKGGIVIYPYWRRRPLGTVEGDFSVFNGWLRGDTGQGQAIMHNTDYEPPQRHTTFIKQQLLSMPGLNEATRRMLSVVKPAEVYVSALSDGRLAVLNYRDDVAAIDVPGSGSFDMKPYSITIIP